MPKLLIAVIACMFCLTACTDFNDIETSEPEPTMQFVYIYNADGAITLVPIYN